MLFRPTSVSLVQSASHSIEVTGASNRSVQVSPNLKATVNRPAVHARGRLYASGCRFGSRLVLQASSTRYLRCIAKTMVTNRYVSLSERSSP